MERPNNGEGRLVERFAWFPVRYTDAPWFAFDSWCHLSWYLAEQVYDKTDAEPWGPSFDWRTVAVRRSRHS